MLCAMIVIGCRHVPLSIAAPSCVADSPVVLAKVVRELEEIAPHLVAEGSAQIIGEGAVLGELEQSRNDDELVHDATRLERALDAQELGMSEQLERWPDLLAAAPQVRSREARHHDDGAPRSVRRRRASDPRWQRCPA